MGKGGLFQATSNYGEKGGNMLRCKTSVSLSIQYENKQIFGEAKKVGSR